MKLSQLGMIVGLAAILVATWTYGSYHKIRSSISMAAAAKNFPNSGPKRRSGLRMTSG